MNFPDISEILGFTGIGLFIGGIVLTMCKVLNLYYVITFPEIIFTTIIGAILFYFSVIKIKIDMN